VSSDLIQCIYNQITSLWDTIQGQLDYVEAMHLALFPKQSAGGQSNAESRAWVLVPCWCCQSAGGDPHWAEPVAAAWGLLYTALHILDSVEDGDPPDGSWSHLNPSQAINVSTGLIVSALLALRDLRRWDVAERTVGELLEDFNLCILRMCGGQHRDLTQAEPSLEECWQTIGLKSGVFFALASRAGARLVTGDPECLGVYHCFGYHLGMLIQIGDDTSGLWATGERQSDLAAGSSWTLPVAYAMSVLPQPVRARLRECLQAARQSSVAEVEAMHLIENAGAILYLTVEAMRHYRRAKAALEKACPPSYARDRLMNLLDSVIPWYSH
jgi:geranylgeranyl pyrophosphate synthase